MTRRFTCAALLAAALFAPGAAAAQDDASRPTSLSLAPFGGTSIGLWHRLSPRLEVGVQAGARFSRLGGGDNRDDFTILELEPAVKLHGGGGAVRPYTYLGLELARSATLRRDEDFEAGVTYTQAGAAAGLGLEWTPAARVRIGGHAGVSSGWLENAYDREPRRDDTASGWYLGTFSSGLTVYYAF